MRSHTKILGVLLLTLAALELVLRAADAMADRSGKFWLPLTEEARGIIEPHPYLGFMYRPGARRSRADDGSGQDLRINNLAMRGADMDPVKPGGVYRILCLGGSTTFGSSVTRDELTYPARLEHYLNESAPDGLRYEVGNCGVNGYNSVESLINLQLRLCEFEPDAIIVYHAANDARPIQARGFRSDYAHMRRAWQAPCVNALDLFLLEHWRTWCWVSRGLDPAEQYRSLGNPIFIPEYRQLHIPSSEEVNLEGVDVFMRNLRMIALVARDRGIEPIFSTFATCRSNYRTGDEDYLETVAAINHGLSELAAELGVALLQVAEALDDKGEHYVRGDWMHFDDGGSDFHARVVLEEARRLSLFGL